MFSHNRFSFGADGTEDNLRAAPVVGPSGRGSAPPSRPNDLNSTTKITHSIFFYPSVSTFTSAAEALARNTCAVCFGSLAQRSTVSRNTINRFIDTMPKDNGTLIVFDANLRQSFYSEDVLKQSMTQCNILKINDEELPTVCQTSGITESDPENQCLALLNRYNLKILILTCGVNGSYIFTSDAKSFLPTPQVKVADTVGAGDSFTAAFTASILSGLPVPAAHRKAVDVSAFVCTQNGAMPVLPAELLSCSATRK